METAITAVVTGLAAIATALFGYLAGKRRESGTVNTTQATELWTRLTSELDNVRAEIERERALRVDLSQQVIELRTELARKESVVASQAATIARHEERIADLYREREHLHALLAEMKAHGHELENRLQRAGREFTEPESDI